MVACEAVGALAAPPGVRGFEATRAFITRVGGASQDPQGRYERFGGLLFALFRNGIGHSCRLSSRWTVPRHRPLCAEVAAGHSTVGQISPAAFERRATHAA